MIGRRSFLESMTGMLGVLPFAPSHERSMPALSRRIWDAGIQGHCEDFLAQGWSEVYVDGRRIEALRVDLDRNEVLAFEKPHRVDLSGRLARRLVRGKVVFR